MTLRHPWAGALLAAILYAVPATAQSTSIGDLAADDQWMPLVEVDGLLIEINTDRTAGMWNANPAAWTRWIYSEPRALSDGSAIYSVAMNYVAYNCSSGEISEEQVTYYDQRGNVVTSEGRSGWIPAVPNSVGEELLAAICYISSGLDEPAERAVPVPGGVARG